MSERWNDQGTGGHEGPGPQFNPGQDPSGQQDHDTQPLYTQQQFHEPRDASQSGYGHPGNQPHGGEQSFPAQQPYTPQQPYAANQHWSQNPTPPIQRSNVLGIVGLLVVVLATGAVVAAAWSIGQGLGEFLVDLAQTGVPRDPDALVNDPRTMAYAETAAGPIGAAVLSCIVGLVGWIISIVATATRRGRVFGIVGIVLGVLSLPLAYGVLTWVLSPVMAQLGG